MIDKTASQEYMYMYIIHVHVSIFQKSDNENTVNITLTKIYVCLTARQIDDLKDGWTEKLIDRKTDRWLDDLTD